MEKQNTGFIFAHEGSCVEIELAEKPGKAISEVTFHSLGASFSITHDDDSEFFHADVELTDGRNYHHLVPSGKDELIELLNEELMRGGKHQVYLRALAAAEPLL